MCDEGDQAATLKLRIPWLQPLAARGAFRQVIIEEIEGDTDVRVKD